MATEQYVTYWVTVERGDTPEWEQVDQYPMLYPAGHANALAASASDMRHAGLDPSVPVRVRVWETATSERIVSQAEVMACEPSAVWIRASIMTADDARRILAGVHIPDDADDLAWRSWAAAEQEAVVRDVLDEEARRNRAAAEREAYTDTVEAARAAVADRLAEEIAEATVEGMFCPVPIPVRGMTRECGNPLPCLRHPKTEQD